MEPDAMKGLTLFNPLYYFVISFQYLIILDRLPPPDVFGIACTFSIAIFALGYSTFHRSKQVFYDFA
jgi:ABC-type polysaccharide/polyol phosphate export permease